MTATYGEFVDAVERVAHRWAEAETFVEDWKALATEEQWNQCRGAELNRELVFRLAHSMAYEYRETVDGTHNDELRHQRIIDGHTFLREIHQIAINLGIEVGRAEIDVPLRLGEELIKAQSRQRPPPENN